ncbi:MAG: hypothetical protein C0478_05135 [Planctomyces sp.]|jgi:hypothetical protein|nr:hypothetical protein [Planctomyces sp.]
MFEIAIRATLMALILAIALLVSAVVVDVARGRGVSSGRIALRFEKAVHREIGRLLETLGVIK